MTRGRRTLLGVTVGLLGVAGMVYVMLLPMRQAPFTVESHGLEGAATDGAAIAGRLKNRGEAAPAVLVEAYLYDAENRYLGTVQTTLSDVPDGATVGFRIPLEPRLAPHVGRYSLYAGTSPNPFAPDR